MMSTGLDRLAAKVQSLEDKYVKILYKKVQALEKCNPCDRPAGKYSKYL